MPTNQQIIDRALYELGFHEYGASADSTDSGDALDALNDLMHEWKYSSKDFNWFTQDTLSDTAPLPKWAVKGVISSLGLRLATKFNITPSAQLYADAKEGEKVIARTLINLGLDNADMSHMPMGEGRRQYYDIEQDTGY